MLAIDINAVFLDDQSLPEDSIYLWAYHIKIINNYKKPVVIKKRVFEVIDCMGQKQVINGVGVANTEPALQPGELFEYASGLLLNQPSGFFSGHYIIEKDGKQMKSELPSFSIDSKYGSVTNQ